MPQILRRLFLLVAVLGSIDIVAAVASLQEPPAPHEAAAPVPRQPVVFELRLHGKAQAPPVGSLHLRGLGDPDEEQITVPVVKAGSADCELPPAAQWELSPDFPGFWGPRQLFTPAPRGRQTRVQVDLWPTGRVWGTLRHSEADEPLPVEIVARIEAPPVAAERERIPVGAVVCPVDRRGRWTCELPAAPLDLSFRVPGHVPLYRWDVRPPAGRQLRLGALVLSRGASIVGWVTATDGASLDKGKVRLFFLQGPGSGGAETRSRLLRPAAETSFGASGFFQLAGVAPGTWLIEVEQPGYAVARLQPVEAWKGRETALSEPIQLARPVSFEVALTPALDWLGHRWHAMVLRANELTGGYDAAPIFEGEVPERGWLVVADQAPGRYWVIVEDSAGNRFLSERDLRLLPGQAEPFELRLDLVPVEGTVSLGEDPLSATLYFGGYYGANRSRLEADEEGVFEGFLPREGIWSVEVRAEEPRLASEVRVEVRARGSGVAAVEIELPDTLVFGRVLGRDQRPVPGVHVSLNGSTASLATRTDADGAFEFRAVAPGEVQLLGRYQAPRGVEITGAVRVPVDESNATGPVLLTLGASESVGGLVRGPLGPIPGAVIRIFPRELASFVETGRSDVEGRFSISVPAEAGPLIVQVSAPGHAFQAFDVPTASEPLLLQIPLEGGDLEVAISDAGVVWENRIAVLWQGDIPLLLGSLNEWAAGHGRKFQDGEGLHVPRLSSGYYTVCIGPPVALAPSQLAVWRQEQARCRQGYLGVHGVLQLAFPAEEPLPVP